MLWPVLILISITSFAEASTALLVEPVAGYTLGGLHVETEVSGDSDNFSTRLEGISLGGKLAAEIDGMHQIGLDYSRKNLNTDNNDTGENFFSVDEYTAFYGVKFYNYRVHGGWMFRSQPVDSRLNSGDGTKIGFTYYTHELLALGAELTTADLRRQKLGSGNEVQGHYSGITILISCPIEIWE